MKKSFLFSFIAIFFLSLCTATALIMFIQIPENLGLEARILENEPETYFSLENPDSCVMEAITSQNLIHVNWDDTQIDELIQKKECNKIFFEEKFYEINFIIKDHQITADLAIITIFWLIIGIIAVISLLKTRYRKSEK